jgi:putative transcriptional regulator
MVQTECAVRRDDMENRIAELRKARRISQAELAEAVAVTRQTIISLESGRYNASLLLAHKIAKYFDTTIEDIFLFEEEES